MIALLAGVSFASGVVPEPVTFEQLAERAGTILVAHPADPPTRREKQTFKSKKVGDYEYDIGLWVVDRVIVGGEGLAAGQTLAVMDPAVPITSSSYEMYADGISAWVIIETYTPGPMPAEPGRLLFLGTGPGPTPAGDSAWCLVASDALEAPARADDAVKARTKSP